MNNLFRQQILPNVTAIVVTAALTGLLFLEVLILNFFTTNDISLSLRIGDVLIGITIYLKTAIDFAIYIANLMEKNRGWKHQFAIVIGTAAGNGIGTLIVLVVWTLFKEVDWLLAIMIFIASLVLVRLAEEGFEHVEEADDKYPRWFKKSAHTLHRGVVAFNKGVAPLLKYVVPNFSMRDSVATSFWSMLKISFTVPFILGLDDFAGYVPLFSVVNVFGFAIGVFVGHLVLCMLLFISPSKTIVVIKNPIISYIGSLVFIGLAIWGMTEVYHLLHGVFYHS